MIKDDVFEMLKSIAPDVSMDSQLIEEGIIDSFAVMNIVVEIESKFNIEFDAEDIVAENFASVDSIAALIEKKMK